MHLYWIYGFKGGLVTRNVLGPVSKEERLNIKLSGCFHQKGEEIQSRKEIRAVRVISQSSTVYNRNTSFKGEKAAGNKAFERRRLFATQLQTHLTVALLACSCLKIQYTNETSLLSNSYICAEAKQNSMSYL